MKRRNGLVTLTHQITFLLAQHSSILFDNHCGEW